MSFSAFSGLELLDSAVFVLDRALRIVYLNPAAEDVFELAARATLGQTPEQVFANGGGRTLMRSARQALDSHSSVTEHDLKLHGPQLNEWHLVCHATPIEAAGGAVLMALQPIDRQIRIANEERILVQQQANRELIRNLAHEIKNPLGGIRGAAQLLERELERPELTEYTQVIIQEAERLQSLIDRLLTPHRIPQVAPVNIHEVLERVRSVLLAETPDTLSIRRDYDTSLPPVSGDKEQLIQVVLNIARNAVQAMQGRGEIVFRSRVARQATLARKRHRLALQLQILDDGPGIPDSIRDNIFYPLVSGRPDGTGLGLTLAQTFVHQHQGTIDFDSRPGHTCFTILLPLQKDNRGNHETRLDH